MGRSDSTPSTPLVINEHNRIRVPQTMQFLENSGSNYSVDFNVRGSPGVRMRDVLDDRARLDDSETRVFENTGLRRFNLVIAWPGYIQNGHYVQVQDKNGFITKKKLAKLISSQFSTWMTSAAPCTKRKWAVGKRGVDFNNIWLVRLAPGHRNVWIAEVELQLHDE
ncbi:uncharacterized protein LAESUDRAFT_642756 [Laetiporus sulphureus 93-53]|uniref:Uncharacterized protein n=1 Tax=Laetiporus sulphureus 93-53 TaxID=1314785 RepID=A0A165H2T1_9APHY|nr:uncharacterized protein LAESUDRAFT_642756 [Laetiporus sulphureus 93-53]KZT11165.1 hypothetical protein LAESUDRAFT_642756 [Laetiporus sulphureus 93-53]